VRLTLSSPASLGPALPRCHALPADSGVPVGASGQPGAAAPAGFHALWRSAAVGAGDRAAGAARAAAECVLTYGVLHDAGLVVTATAPRAAVGVTLVQAIGIGRLRLLAPCRIVAVEESPERSGFTYATLPGHPEQGEETFMITRADDGTVWATVSSLSRPAALAARIGAPLAARAQRAVVGRYLAAIARAADAAVHR